MIGSNLFTRYNDTLWLALDEENGLAMFAKCLGIPPIIADIFEHGCLMIQTDTGGGNPSVYQNIGTSSIPIWDLFQSGAFPGLPDNEIWFGDSFNMAIPHPITGDATTTNTGILTVSNNAINYAKMQNMSATKLLLGSSATTNDIQEIVLGTGLSMALNTLNVSGFMSNTLTDKHIFVGNMLNIATDVAVTGVVGIDDTGLTKFGSFSSADLINALTDETGTGVAVFNSNPTFNQSINIGTVGTYSGIINLIGKTSGQVNLSVQDAAGNWTMKLPTIPGSIGQVLQSSTGFGDTSWVTPFTNPMTTLGDTIYKDVLITNRLPGNTTTTRKFLRQQGTGAMSAAPAWDTLLASDIPLALNHIFVGAAGNTANDVAMSGDATIASSGVLTIANNAVTYAKMQGLSALSKLLGSSSGTNPVQEITLGNGLSMQGATLNTAYPTVVYSDVQLNQGADITAQVMTTTAGLYRFSYYLLDSVADLTAGKVNIAVKYQDDAASQELDSSTVLLTTLGLFTQGIFIVELTSASNITYQVNHIGVYGTAKYNVYVTLERLR